MSSVNHPSCEPGAEASSDQPCIAPATLFVTGRILHSWVPTPASAWPGCRCSCRPGSGNEALAGQKPSPPATLSFGGPHNQAVVPSYIVAKGRPPTHPADSAVATYTRLATQGVAPYRYHSSNPAVAVVDQNGRVVAAGNGSADIYATDSLGNQVFYTITFSGVKQVSIEENVGWPGPVGNPLRPVYALNRRQLQQFWLQYKDESPDKTVPQLLGWPNTSYWTSENVETNENSWAVNFDALVPDFNGFEAHGSKRWPALRRLGFD